MKIVIVMAQTLDGKIARDAKHCADWTSTEDKKSFAAESKKHGVIIMGSTTFDTIGRPLPGRLNIILTRDPKRYKDKAQPGLLEFIKGTPAEIVQLLESRGFTSAALGGGSKTNAAFLKAGLVDELLITIEPKIFGGGVAITEGETLDLNLELLELNKLNDHTIQFRYKIKK